MLEHEVWELADLPPGRKAVSCKWVFKEKTDGDGKIHTYKARLVARGFSQQYGDDYDETFAPVVKHETVRVLLTLAAQKKYHVRHLDVKSADLNGELDQEIYMDQPEGYVIPVTEGNVLKLAKSIYGLKQSTRVWNKTAAATLKKMGFKAGNADKCLYTRKEADGTTSYVLVYVDDMMVAGATEERTKTVGDKLGKFFQMKDLGDVSHYIGIQIERTKLLPCWRKTDYSTLKQ